MVSSSAETVEQYLAELAPERREDVATIRKMLVKALPRGLEEVMNWGMICYQIPFSMVPKTYNGEPLVYAALAAQKNYISLYLMSIYAFDEARAEFESAWRKTGHRFDVGKACIRFRSLQDVPLEVVSKAARQISLAEYVGRYQELRSSRKTAK